MPYINNKKKGLTSKCPVIAVNKRSHTLINH